MKSEFLKIAGVKSESAFYKKYPTEKEFFSAHPEAKKMVKKAQNGLDLSFMNSTFQGINNIPNMNNMVQGQMSSPGVNAQMFNGPQVINTTPDYNQMYMNMSTADEQLKQPKSAGINKGLESLPGMAGSLAKGFSALKSEKKALNEAKKWAAVTDVQAQAAESTDIDNYRQYAENVKKRRKAFMPEMTGEEVFPVYGVGTNVLAKNGAEITNTYDPGTIYDDLGYEPLDDSNQIKSYKQGGELHIAQNGFSNWMNTLGGGGNGFSGASGSINGGGTPWGAIGQIGGSLSGSLTGNNAGGQIGGTVGEAAGAMFGPAGMAIGKTAGTLIGGLADTNIKKMKKAENASERNINRMMGAQFKNNFQQQYGAYAEDGININPQIISEFGEHKLSSLLSPPNDVDMLRSGGHISGSYIEPNTSGLSTMEEGGELNTYWGGYAEPMSYNPFLPDSGETVMFRGQSHDESDGKGNTGIGITFGDNPVEVERGEPATKLRDGGTGEDNLVVYGNLQIPKYGVELLGDKKAEGKKFKNYITDLSKVEQKQNKIIENSTNDLDELNVKTPFDKLKMSSLEANIKGGNMKLKSIADKKIKAADLQSAINDTAEEYGLIADDLAKGKIKIDKKTMKLKEAMFGTNIPKAQGGYKTKGRGDKWSFTKAGETGNPTWDDMQRYENKWTPTVNTALGDKDRAERMLTYIENYSGEGSTNIKKALNKIPSKEGKIMFLQQQATNKQVGPIHNVVDAAIKFTAPNMTTPLKEEKKETPKEKNRFEVIKHKRNPWLGIGYQTLKGLLDKPYEEDLNKNQLLGETYALSSNQLEPVQAQPYSPQLRIPYDISLQDQLNEITADQRSAQRMMGYNPAAQANLAAQSFNAKSKVLADQFRANQAMKDQVYSGNIATLNDAELKNLAIYDQQYQRQAQAKSNTKAINQAALSSIADKYAQHARDVRTYNTYKTLFPQYGFDRSGKGRFEGGFMDWNIPQKYQQSLNPNVKVVRNADGTLSYVKDEETEPTTTATTQRIGSTPGINPNSNIVYQDDDYDYELVPINQTEVMNEVAPKKYGGKIKKNYSQSSIVKAFK